ncbi:MAG: glutathione S-transferase family protein [Cyanobacteria bacterium P01_H01_bin.15]
MLKLYQFELSQYSEKVRLILDFKGLDYQKIEVTPGIGQIELLRLSGQRQVPVLQDGDLVIADSTEIAFYLDRKYPDSPLIPIDPYRRGLCLMTEEWADESIGLKSRVAFFAALKQSQNLRTSLLPTKTPDFLKSLVGSAPRELLDVLGTGVGLSKEAINSAMTGLKQDLEALTLILQTQPYLTGQNPTLADLTVAGLSLLLKFPDQAYVEVPLNLLGSGVPGLADDAQFAPFFDWRDRLYADFRNPSNATSVNTPGQPPVTIEID